MGGEGKPKVLGWVGFPWIRGFRGYFLLETPDPHRKVGTIRIPLGAVVDFLTRTRQLERQNGVHPDQLLKWIERAKTLVDDTITKKEHASLYLQSGRLLTRLGRKGEAIAAYRRSIDIYPHPGNEANHELRKTLQGTEGPVVDGAP